MNIITHSEIMQKTYPKLELLGLSIITTSYANPLIYENNSYANFPANSFRISGNRKVW